MIPDMQNTSSFWFGFQVCLTAVKISCLPIMHAIKKSVYQLRHSIRSKEQRTYQKLKRPLRHKCRRDALRKDETDTTKCLTSSEESTRNDQTRRLQSLDKNRPFSPDSEKPILNSNENNCGVPLHCSPAPPQSAIFLRWFTDRKPQCSTRALRSYYKWGGARDNFGTSDFFGSLHLGSGRSQCELCHFAFLSRWKLTTCMVEGCDHCTSSAFEVTVK